MFFLRLRCSIVIACLMLCCCQNMTRWVMHSTRPLKVWCAIWHQYLAYRIQHFPDSWEQHFHVDGCSQNFPWCISVAVNWVSMGVPAGVTAASTANGHLQICFEVQSFVCYTEPHPFVHARSFGLATYDPSSGPVLLHVWTELDLDHCRPITLSFITFLTKLFNPYTTTPSNPWPLDAKINPPAILGILMLGMESHGPHNNSFFQIFSIFTGIQWQTWSPVRLCPGRVNTST